MENFTTKKESTKIEKKKKNIALNVYISYFLKRDIRNCLYFCYLINGQKCPLGISFQVYNLNKETQHHRCFFKFSRIFILLYPGFTLLVRIGTRARMQYCIRISVRARSMNNRLAICNTLGFYLHSLVFTSYLKLICTYTS